MKIEFLDDELKLARITRGFWWWKEVATVRRVVEVREDFGDDDDDGDEPEFPADYVVNWRYVAPGQPADGMLYEYRSWFFGVEDRMKSWHPPMNEARDRAIAAREEKQRVARAELSHEEKLETAWSPAKKVKIPAARLLK